MTRGKIIGDFFKKTVFPVCVTLLIFFMFKNVDFFHHADGSIDYLWMAVLCGIPWGIQRMYLWIIPHGYDIGGTVGIWALNIIIGGIIGSVVLLWKLLVAVWYIPLTIYRMIKPPVLPMAEPME